MFIKASVEAHIMHCGHKFPHGDDKNILISVYLYSMSERGYKLHPPRGLRQTNTVVEYKDTISALMSALLCGRTSLSLTTAPLAASRVAPAGARSVRSTVGRGGVVGGRW